MKRTTLRKVSTRWSCDEESQIAYFHVFYPHDDNVIALLENEEGVVFSYDVSNCYEFKFID